MIHKTGAQSSKNVHRNSNLYFSKIVCIHTADRKKEIEESRKLFYK